jgi:hypothetical protein
VKHRHSNSCDSSWKLSGDPVLFQAGSRIAAASLPDTRLGDATSQLTLQ